MRICVTKNTINQRQKEHNLYCTKNILHLKNILEYTYIYSSIIELLHADGQTNRHLNRRSFQPSLLKTPGIFKSLLEKILEILKRMAFRSVCSRSME
jgi:hypothetical protein